MIDGGNYLLLTVVPADKTAPDTRLWTTLWPQICWMMSLTSDSYLPICPQRIWADLQSKSRPLMTWEIAMCCCNSLFILNLFDQVIEKTNSFSFIKVKVCLNQFGQEDPDTLQLSDLADPSSVKSVSVHMACKCGQGPWHPCTFFPIWIARDCGSQRPFVFHIGDAWGHKLPDKSRPQWAECQWWLDGCPWKRRQGHIPAALCGLPSCICSDAIQASCEWVRATALSRSWGLKMKSQW